MKKIRVGIMGTGEIARVMAMTLAKTKGVVCYAVGSRTYARAEEFAKEHKIKKFYGSYEALVGDQKVDLIYVATPHAMHFENARLAIESRKAVLVEKAFTINEAQAQRLIQMARERNVLLAEAIWTRYMPMRARLREVLSSEVIGIPTMLTANLSYPVSQRERMREPALGGGALLDLGVYPLNFASMVFGNDITEISSVCTKGETGVDLQDSITLVYRDGRIAQLNCSCVSLSDRQGVIYGTKGYIIVHNINDPESIEVYDSSHNRIQHIKRPKQISGYEYELYACAAAIRNNQIECAEMPHSETVKMLNIMDFIRKQTGVSYPGEDGFTAAEPEPVMPTAEALPEPLLAEQTEAAPVEQTEPAAIEQQTAFEDTYKEPLGPQEEAPAPTEEENQPQDDEEKGSA